MLQKTADDGLPLKTSAQTYDASKEAAVSPLSAKPTRHDRRASTAYNEDLRRLQTYPREPATSEAHKFMIGIGAMLTEILPSLSVATESAIVGGAPQSPSLSLSTLHVPCALTKNPKLVLSCYL